MSPPTITITLKLFAIYQEVIGQETQTLRLPLGTTPQALLQQLATTYPVLQAWQAQTRFGQNLNFVPGDAPLQDGDELVLVPPVSGG